MSELLTASISAQSLGDRGKHHLPRLPGTRIHTTSRPLTPLDVVTRHGIRLTAPTRTILDAAQYGTAPEQIEMAIQQAVQRGLLDPERLLTAAQGYDTRVRDLLKRGLNASKACPTKLRPASAWRSNTGSVRRARSSGSARNGSSAS